MDSVPSSLEYETHSNPLCRIMKCLLVFDKEAVDLRRQACIDCMQCRRISWALWILRDLAVWESGYEAGTTGPMCISVSVRPHDANHVIASFHISLQDSLKAVRRLLLPDCCEAKVILVSAMAQWTAELICKFERKGVLVVVLHTAACKGP